MSSFNPLSHHTLQAGMVGLGMIFDDTYRPFFSPGTHYLVTDNLEVGIRVGEFLGRSHYKVFHTTGTAGKLAAAAGVAHILKLDADKMQHCLGSAGTMAAGLWEFLRDAADSKQLHTGKAAADGLMAAYIARAGLYRQGSGHGAC